LANIHRDRRRFPRPWPLTEFVLRIGDAAPPGPTRTQQTAQQRFDAIVLALKAHAAGGRRGPARRR